MLTKKEKVWLERRKYPCVHCVHYGRTCDTTPLPEGYSCEWMDLDVDDPDFEDAAEFEAKTALWLTHNACTFEEPCSYARGKSLRAPWVKGMCPHIPHKDGYCNRWCKLMTARLIVEQEMEKQQ